MAIIGERAARGQTVTAHGLALFVLPSFQRALNGPHSTDQLLQFSLGMPIRFEDGACCFVQVVKVAELMRHVG
jgi:hypothetical protein